MKDKEANKGLPTFLSDMRKDHPGIVMDIESRLNDWCAAVDDKSGIPGFSKTILEHMEYVRREEIEEFVTSVAQEVKQIRETDPTRPIRFVSWDSEKGSGRWFYEQLSRSLSDSDRKNVDHISFTRVYDHEMDLPESPIYFYLDDAANSGQQVQQGIYAFRSVIGKDGDGKLVQRSKKGKPIDLHIRLLRITDHVKDFIDDQRHFFVDADGSDLVIIDTDSNPLANQHMPTTQDVIDRLDLSKDEIDSTGMFFQGHHGRFPATLAIFWHKVQDNMPIALIQGRYSSHIMPLITKENMSAIRTQYS